MKFRSVNFGLIVLFSFFFLMSLNQTHAQEIESSLILSEKLNNLENNVKIIKNQHQNSNTTENLNLSIALFTGVAIPIGLLIYQPIRSKRTLVNQNSVSLIKEIESNEGALTGKQDYPIVNYTGLDDEKSSIKYTNAFLDYDSYENLINSGQFSYFVPETQFSLRELYTRIKDHDRTMKYIDELEDKFKLEFPDDNKKFLQAVARYEVVLTLWESQILELIPSTKTNLENEKKFVI